MSVPKASKKWIYAYKMPKTLEPWFLSVIDQFFFHMTEKNVKTIHPLCFFELSKISKNEKINRHLSPFAQMTAKSPLKQLGTYTTLTISLP